ncbi:WXG100-like domain-containing protein [Phytomonospora endophytica]|uniref:Outer membrane channel protein CpnT-like N-terminal domain-containing protein n=1 Tax=Phytomonospora endophytica TaxID=714109 RepID=A0A841FV04_9ACTN|nr:hypothetical protein [Phytomonospora endophytica]MBB6037548.1 hypothetical protein [Phytomonospora endophytica]GIG70249.1 hypothetical protein Pen01_65440 [Phytomonospora endophytica]
MGIDIPGELADLLNQLGYTWPKSDETALFELGGDWLSFAGKLQPIAGDAAAAADKARTGNVGEAIEAFGKAWDDEDSAVSVLGRAVVGSQIVGGALYVCAAIVLALKIAVIVQLTILLIQIIQAIATAAVTFGASLAEIPIFKKLADIAIDIVIDKALEAILG